MSMQEELDFREECLRQAKVQSALMRQAPEEGYWRILAQLRTGNLLLAVTVGPEIYEYMFKVLMESLLREGKAIIEERKRAEGA